MSASGARRGRHLAGIEFNMWRGVEGAEEVRGCAALNGLGTQDPEGAAEEVGGIHALGLAEGRWGWGIR